MTGSGASPKFRSLFTFSLAVPSGISWRFNSRICFAGRNLMVRETRRNITTMRILREFELQRTFATGRQSVILVATISNRFRSTVGVSASVRHASEIQGSAQPRQRALAAAIPNVRVPKPIHHSPNSNSHPPKRSQAQALHRRGQPRPRPEEAGEVCRLRRPNLRARQVRMWAREEVEVLEGQTVSF
jgi:hypothetical protein